MLTIYGIPISVHTRKAILTASVKKLDFQVEPVVPFDPPPQWQALSPTGLIPAISDGDFTLADSGAICQYLDLRHPRPGILPAEPRDRARCLWFESYAGGTVFRNIVHGLFFQKVLQPTVRGQKTDDAEIGRILNEVLPGVFGYLESVCGRPFLVGDGLTLADIALVSTLVNYHYLGFAIDRDRFPRLAAYWDAMIVQEPFAEALAAEEPFASRMALDRSFLA